MNSAAPTWLATAEALAKAFSDTHSVVMRLTDRQLSAAFEIGTLHALLKFYASQGYVLTPQNLIEGSEYRYLTSPSGNPANFSFVQAVGDDGELSASKSGCSLMSMRTSAFTPDIVVLLKGAAIDDSKRVDCASGKRPHYRVASSSVVAAHEGKSMNPFPELLVSFIGILKRRRDSNIYRISGIVFCIVVLMWFLI